MINQRYKRPRKPYTRSLQQNSRLQVFLLVLLCLLGVIAFLPSQVRAETVRPESDNNYGTVIGIGELFPRPAASASLNQWSNRSGNYL
jgi:hypothetical protein